MNINEASLDVNVNEILSAEFRDEVKLDSDSDEDDSFQDLVIKFSNIGTLLEPGRGKIVYAYENDVRHKIDKNDGAVIIGVSKQDHIPEHSVGHSAENDARVMFDICKIQLGMKPNRVKLLTVNTKKPFQKNIKSALKEIFKTAEEKSLVVVYFSGHGYVKNDNHYLIPQDFKTDDIKGTGIRAQDLFRWMSHSKADRILFLLDCCYAELLTEAMFREREAKYPALKKHLYLLSSSEITEPSVSDETWLEHGYMTFLIKHYFNFIAIKRQQVSVRQLTRFLKRYCVPLSQFTYTAYDGQVCERPILAHLGPDSLIEVDAAADDLLPCVSQEEVDYWKGYIKKTRTYNNWWAERLLDAKAVIGDPTFSYSNLFYVLYLNGLHSACILMCEQDRIQRSFSQSPTSFEAFAKALAALFLSDLKSIAHWEIRTYDGLSDDCNPRAIISSGIMEGRSSVKQPTAPPIELLPAFTIHDTST